MIWNWNLSLSLSLHTHTHVYQILINLFLGQRSLLCFSSLCWVHLLHKKRQTPSMTHWEREREREGGEKVVVGGGGGGLRERKMHTEMERIPPPPPHTHTHTLKQLKFWRLTRGLVGRSLGDDGVHSLGIEPWQCEDSPGHHSTLCTATLFGIRFTFKLNIMHPLKTSSHIP